MTPKLSSLPTELIELIASKVGPRDLLATRLVCRDLDEKSFRSVGETVFSEFHSDLSCCSLRKLKELSEHEHFRNHVRALLIREPLGFRNESFWPRHPDGHLTALLPRIEILRKVLIDGLVNCRDFTILSPDREYPSRDIIHVSWHSKIYLPSNDSMESTDPTLLDPPPHQTSQFQSGWAHLEKLELHSIKFPENLDWTTGLVLGASNLQELTLSVPNMDNSRRLFSSFLERLSLASSLPRLQQLNLSYVKVEENLLSRVILRFCDSLRGLSFQHAVMDFGGTWRSAIREWGIKLKSLEYILLEAIFEKNGGSYLYTDFPLLIDDPVVPDTGGYEFTLIMVNRCTPSKVRGVQYKGPRMDKALEKLAASVNRFKF